MRLWRGNPWWIPPFLGSTPAMAPELLRLLGLVALALFFESYDISMLTAALKFIASDLGIAEADLGTYLAVIRLGALPAFVVIPWVDRLGRRRLFLASVVGSGLGTFATAFTQTAEQFVAVQMATRVFLVIGAATALVIVTEELPAAHRGWGIGILGALAATGHGLGAGLFAAIDLLPGGWRALYAIGIAPVAMLGIFRRGIRETARFERHAATRGSVEGWHRPLVALARASPVRALLLAVAALLFAVADAPVYQFTGYFTQTVHGWSPGQYASMVILGGSIGIVGNVVAGRLGDRIGRRLVGLLFLGAFPLATWTFYQGPSWVIPLGFAMFVFCETAGHMVLRALSTELFPTSHRGTSAGWIVFVQTLGWAAGLALVSTAAEEVGDLAWMVTVLSLVAILGGLVLLLLPETRRRELEAISPEAAPSTG